LRATWTLKMCDEIDPSRLNKALSDSDEYVRAWAIQFLAEDPLEAETLEQFAALAKSDPSPVVRLYLASAMQRTPVEKRKEIMQALIAHGEDANDQNLPLMYWYALEPLVAADKKTGAALLARAKIPKVRELITRRMTE